MCRSDLSIVCSTAGQPARLNSRSSKPSPGTSCRADPEQCLAWAGPQVHFIKRAGRHGQLHPALPSHREGNRDSEGPSPSSSPGVHVTLIPSWISPLPLPVCSHLTFAGAPPDYSLHLQRLFTRSKAPRPYSTFCFCPDHLLFSNILHMLRISMLLSVSQTESKLSAGRCLLYSLTQPRHLAQNRDIVGRQ